MGLDTRGMTAGAAQAQGTIAKLSTGVQKGLGISVPLAAAAGAAAVVKFGADSVSAAIEATEAHIKLGNTFDNNARLSDSSVAAFERQADSIRKLTGVDDELIISGQAVLGQFDLTGQQVQKLTPLIVDLAEKMGIDLEAAAKAVGKAATGNVGVLSRYGIAVEAADTKSGQFANTLEALGKVQGFAAERAKAEPWRVLGSTFEEVQEKLGRLLLDLGTKAVPILEDLVGVADLAADNLDVVLTVLIGFAAVRFLPGLLLNIALGLERVALVGASGGFLKVAAGIAGWGAPAIAAGVGVGILATKASDLNNGVVELGESLDRVVSEDELGIAVANWADAISRGDATIDEAVEAFENLERGVAAQPAAFAGAKISAAALEQQLRSMLDLGAERGDAFASAWERTHSVVDEVAPDIAGDIGEIGRAHEKAAAAARAHLLAELGLADGLLGLVATAQSYADAQKEVERLQERGRQGTRQYREASLELLQTGIALKSQTLAYAQSLVDSGRSHENVIAKVRKFGDEAGLTRDDVDNLLSRVLDLGDAYGDLPARKSTKIFADTSGAMAEVAALQEELLAVEHRDWIAHIQVTTSGGSTGFHLIEMLRAELDSLEDRDWRANVDVSVFTEGIRGTQRVLEHLADVESAIGSAVGEGLSKSFLREAKELEAAGDDLITKLERKGDRLQRVFDSLQERAEEFGDSVRSAFDIDLAGGLARLEELNAATASEFFATQLAQAQQFASALTQLQEQGLSQAGLEQLIGQGPDQGLEVAQLLLASPELLAQFNATQTALDNLGKTTEDTLIDGVFGPSLEKAAAHIERFTENAAERLDAFADRVRTFVESFDRASLPKKFEDLGESLDRLLRLLGGDGRPSDGRHPPGASAPAGAMAVARSFDGDYRASDRRIEVDIRTDWPAAIDQIDGELYKSDRRGGGLAHHRGT